MLGRRHLWPGQPPINTLPKTRPEEHFEQISTNNQNKNIFRAKPPRTDKVLATKESEAEFEARMQSDLNRILTAQKTLHLQTRGLPPPASVVNMRTQAFLEQAEIHRRARKGWVGAISCIPWPIRSNRARTPYMGSKWLRFFRVIHRLIKKSTPLKTGNR